MKSDAAVPKAGKHIGINQCFLEGLSGSFVNGDVLPAPAPHYAEQMPEP